MKTVILCGGRGTRLGAHGASVPKALIEIGEKPVIWHLLKIYSHYGFDDFILCLGFLGDKIKRFFLEQNWLNADFTLEKNSNLPVLKNSEKLENWRLTFAETGAETNTGGRLKRIEKYLAGEETFFVTYGDGLANVNLEKLAEFHKSHGRIATLTAVHPHSNFGIMKLGNDNFVTEFQEKPVMREWINGGFFVFDRRVFDYLDDNSILEREPLERLAKEKQLVAFPHDGFWKCVDTFKDNLEFNQLWTDKRADWKVW
ncbi:MAG TPA: glucose-1-phosphate cytidylyltransferase [Pyrinomonadaceae bacterium]|jgi:glucose-1-phosphate cytidylyltransferase